MSCGVVDKTATNTLIGKITQCTGNVMQLLCPTSISVWIKCDLSTIVCHSIKQFEFERLACKSVYKQDAGVLKARLNWQLQTNTAIQISDIHRSQNVTIKIKKQPSLEITQLCLLITIHKSTSWLGTHTQSVDKFNWTNFQEIPGGISRKIQDMFALPCNVPNLLLCLNI